MSEINRGAPGPRAKCWKCGRQYSGWSLAKRETCECGGKLIIDFPYNILIGYARAGRPRNAQGYVEEAKTDNEEAKTDNSVKGEERGLPQIGLRFPPSISSLIFLIRKLLQLPRREG